MGVFSALSGFWSFLAPGFNQAAVRIWLNGLVVGLENRKPFIFLDVQLSCFGPFCGHMMSNRVGTNKKALKVTGACQFPTKFRASFHYLKAVIWSPKLLARVKFSDKCSWHWDITTPTLFFVFCPKCHSTLSGRMASTSAHRIFLLSHLEVKILQMVGRKKRDKTCLGDTTFICMDLDL